MSLGKTYYRYAQKAVSGVVCSPGVNVLYDGTGKLALAGALEQSVAWSVRTGERLHLCRPGQTSPSGHPVPGAEVTVQALSPADDRRRLAVGYADGGVRIFELLSQGAAGGDSGVECRQCAYFPGHRGAVRALAYDAKGALLASGGVDCDIVLWDLTAETGLFRLKGHRDAITQLYFMRSQVVGAPPAGPSGGGLLGSGVCKLMSSSKDTLLKVWDLEQQRCVETVVGHRAEIWDFAVAPDQSRVVTMSSASDMKVWTLDVSADPEAISSGESMREMEEEEDEEEEDRTRPADADDAADAATMHLKLRGPIRRAGTERGVSVRFNVSGTLMGCHGTGKSVEVYRRRAPAEILKKMKRRLKRLREKKRQRDEVASKVAGAAGIPFPAVPSADDEEEEDTPVRVEDATTSDEFALVGVVRCPSRVQSFDFAPTVASSSSLPSPRTAKIIVSLVNNTMQEFEVDLKDKMAKKGAAPSATTHRLALQGHRGDVRAVAVNASDDLVATVSRKMVKLWSARSQQCVRSSEIGYGLSVTFVPGDRYVLCGTKDGRIVLVSVQSGDVVQELAVHDGQAVWSLSIKPDGSGFCSGSADKTVKFFDFELSDGAPRRQTEDGGDSGGTAAANATAPAPKGVLQARHVRTLKMDDEVLCVRYSHTPSKDPRKTLVAVSTLDSTVKVFFDDSLKFFLSMYGHKLPVMSMDISSDDALLVTASADKNVKIWGLDFGDCHKSIFAHADAVMAVAFVPRTHYFFSGAKDGVVKMWDADHFEQVITMRGHHGEIWGLAVSNVGDFVVSCANDRSIRLWERTDEQVFLEEERERELEESFESSLDTRKKGGDGHGIGSLAEGGAGGALGADGRPGANEDAQESAPAGKRSVANVRAGELLIEALELAATEQDRIDEYFAAVREAEERKRERQRKGRPGGGSDNESEDEGGAVEVVGGRGGGSEAGGGGEATRVPMPKANILMLGRTPLQHVVHHLKLVRPVQLTEALLVMPLVHVQKMFRFVDAMMDAGLQVEMGAKVLFFLLKTHQDTLVSNHAMLDRIAALREKTRARLTEHRDRMGVNHAALQFIQRELKDRRTRFGQEGGAAGEAGWTAKRPRLGL